MMVNYKVTNYKAHISAPAKQTADVVEVGTGLTIKADISVQEARDLCRHLNFGGGFDGWTPGFFNEKIKGLVYSEENFYK